MTSGHLRVIPPSERVDPLASDDLISGAQDQAASLLDPRIGRAERLSRAEIASRRLRDVRAIVEAVNPYAGTGQHAKLADALAIAGKREWQAVVGDVSDAVERYNQSRQYDRLRTQTRAWADLGPLLDATPTVASVSFDNPAVWLNSVYVKAALEPAWCGIRVRTVHDS